MRLIAEEIGPGLRLIGGGLLGGSSAPGLSLSSASVPENTAQGTTIGVAVPRGASNPGDVTIVSQTLANAIAMTGDGISFAVGSAGGPTGTLNYEVVTSFSVTFEYTDDNDTYQFVRSFAITDVDDGPTIAGAATDLETMVGAPQVGTEVSGDLRDLFVSPTGQSLAFQMSHGSVSGEGYSWAWTPDTAGLTTVSITAIDEDGQELAIDIIVDVIAVNTAPTVDPETYRFVVPEGEAPALASGTPADNATGVSVGVNPTATFDKPIKFLSSGTITLYNKTDTAAHEVFAIPADIGTGAGQASISGSTLTLKPTSPFGNGKNIAWLWSGGPFGNLGDIPVADLSSDTVLDFTTSGSASAPEQFDPGDWSVSDDGTDGDVTISITALPNNGGSAITDLEYQIDGGSWVSLGATTTGDYGVSGLTNGTSYDFALRAVNAIGNGTASTTKSATPTAVPAAFTVGQWTLTDLTTGGDARIAISALPAANGTAITDLEVKIGAGAWTSLGGTSTGNYDLLDDFTDGVSTNVLIRAVNATGNGSDSDTKSVTTTSSGGITIVGYRTNTFTGSSPSDDLTQFTPIGGGAPVPALAGDYVLHLSGWGAGTNDTPAIGTSGYTILDPGTDRFMGASASKTNCIAGIKLMPGTPDTVLNYSGPNNGGKGGTAITLLLRGVDPAQAFSVAELIGGGATSILGDPDAITPVDAGSLIILLQIGSYQSTEVVIGAPANMTEIVVVNNTTGTRSSVALAAYTYWTGGAFNPDAPELVSGADSSGYGRLFYLIALKPA